MERGCLAEERFNAFQRIPLEVFAMFLRLVPFSRLPMFTCTCKFAFELRKQDKILQAFMMSFRSSFWFVSDYYVLSEYVKKGWNNEYRFQILIYVYQGYFGKRMSRHNFEEIHLERVVCRDLFPGMRRKHSFYLGNMHESLMEWLMCSFSPFRSNCDRFNLRRNMPSSCISVLRHAGIFSTMRTRQAFIKCLTRMIPVYCEKGCISFCIMLNFLLRLTSESFVFDYTAVDSWTFDQPGRIRQLTYSVTRKPLIDICEDDFNMWYYRFKKLYGKNFLEVEYNDPSSWYY